MTPSASKEVEESKSHDVVPKNTMEELFEWNLVDHISPYLDRHLIFPLLDYLEKQIRDIPATDRTKSLLQDVNVARYTLLRPTHMMDYVMDVYSTWNDSIPPEMEQQKQIILQDLERLQKQCAPFLEEITSTERVRENVP
jgi:translation initiation factor 3 subunit E